MLVLYEFGNSVCCQKVRLVLCEKGLAWQSRQVNLFRSEQYDPEYLKLNPKGVVPTLVHDGRPVIESTLICEYIESIFPEPHLMPAAAYERARMRLWGKAVDEGLHEGVTEISFSSMFRERMKNMSESEREARFRNVGDPKRRDRFRLDLRARRGVAFRALGDRRLRAGVQVDGRRARRRRRVALR
jgi:glutathione S-transferase